MRRFLYLVTKKCRIYAACGVSQTPNIKINGKERLVRNVVMPGEENNTSRYAMIFVRDITEAEKRGRSDKGDDTPECCYG